MNEICENERPDRKKSEASGCEERAENKGGTKDVIIGGEKNPEKTRGFEGVENEHGRHKRARQAAFLEAFSMVGSIIKAAEVAKIGRTSHWEWLKVDPEYAKAFAAAQIVATEALIDEATRRAVQGVQEPVGWYQGVPGGTVTRYSDILLIFLIKARRPEYRDSTHIQIGLDPAGDGDPRLGEKTLGAVEPLKLEG